MDLAFLLVQQKAGKSVLHLLYYLHHLIDTVDLLMGLEDELNISVELDEKVETVGDLVRFIEKKQAEEA